MARSATYRNNNHKQINDGLTAELFEAFRNMQEASKRASKTRTRNDYDRLDTARNALKATKARVKAEALGSYYSLFEAAGLYN